MGERRSFHDRLHILKTCFLVVLMLSDSVCAAEPFTFGTIAAATMAGIYTAGQRLWCSFGECCNTNWAQANVTALKTVMKERVYGQHLVEEVVLNTIQGHVRNPNPAKALVLSFHGWTGGGKNYVSRLIAESLFKAGMDSKYVHLFVATLHFPHKSHLEEYKMQLREWITTNVTKCGWQLFIFDEMDKMQSGMIDVIKPFLDHYPEIRGVDYRKSIYIFLSNTGGNDISMKTFEHWKAGKKREDITVKEMDELLQVHAFNEQGGLWHSDLIEKHLISFFVPFLPLERSHVMKCIVDDMRSKGYGTDPDIIKKIANELQYSPQDSPVFSVSGCKRVSEKVNFVMFDFFNTEL